MRLLRGVFDDDAEHTLLWDFKDVVEDDNVPSYFIHVIQKTGTG